MLPLDVEIAVLQISNFIQSFISKNLIIYFRQIHSPVLSCPLDPAALPFDFHTAELNNADKTNPVLFSDSAVVYFSVLTFCKHLEVFNRWRGCFLLIGNDCVQILGDRKKKGFHTE